MKHETKTTAATATKTTKPKKGTVGFEIAKLVKRYGHYSLGHYILAAACAEATGKHFSLFDAPKYKAVLETERQIFESLGPKVGAAAMGLNTRSN